MGSILAEAVGDILRYVVQMLPCALAGTALFAAVLPLRRRRLAEKGLYSPPPREAGLFLFVLFCSGLAALTLFPSNLWNFLLFPNRWPQDTTWLDFYPSVGETWLRLQGLPERLPRLLTPFPGGITRHFETYWRAFLFLGNIGMFLPVGFFPALLWRRGGFFRSVLVGFFSSLSIEILQFFIDRGTDLDDLILNTAGTAAGYLCFLLLRRWFPGFTAKFVCVKV